jgi:hypothetical protein
MIPRASRRSAVLLASLLAFGSAPGLAQEVSDEAVRKHIDRLVESLIDAQRADGTWDYGGYPVGMTSLAVYALLHAGLPKDHPAVEKGVKAILRRVDGKVYSESLAICALELAGPEAYRNRISNAVRFLSSNQASSGGWSYPGNNRSFDNSNTQFAVLGLAAAERCGVPVAAKVKEKALDHWLRCRSQGGGWGYTMGDQSLSMTCAGIASLQLLGRDHEKPGSACGDYRYDEVIARGLKALVGEIRSGGIRGMIPSYTLYALERVGMFLDLKEIDGLDWYRWGASAILSSGSAGNPANQALELLFLAKGEAQVALAKWRWKGDWNNDHRDLKTWTALAGDALGLKLDWVPAALDDPASPAAKASAIFVSGHGAFSATDEETDFARRFLARNGTLIAEACCGKEAFVESFKEYVRGLFAGSPVQFIPVGAGHPLCSLTHALAPEDIAALEVRTGCRKRRVLILTRDISCPLTEETRSAGEKARAEKVAVNLLEWAIRARAPRGKLDKVSLSAEGDGAERPEDAEGVATPAGASRKLRHPFGRLIHRGEWNADPAFYPTLAAALAAREEVPRFDGEIFVRPGSEDLFACPVLFVSGHGDPLLDKAEWMPLRAYLEAGGTIVASSCCGFEEFDAGFRRLLAKVLPNDRLEEVPAEDELWKAPFPREAIPVNGTKGFAARHGNALAPLLGIRREGRWIVIYSPVDLCCDLEGDLDEDAASYRKATSIPIWADILRTVFTP